MNKFDLFPSVNWNVSRMLVINNAGTVCAYGSRGDIIIMKNVHRDHFNELENKIISAAHKNARVLGLVFVEHEIEGKLVELLASCGDDGRIKIWDIESSQTTHKSVLKENNLTSPLKLVDIDYFSRTDCIVSVAEQGCIVKWDLQQNKVWTFNVPVKSQLSCVAACPHSDDLVAIGTRFGRVVVFSVKGEGKLIHRLLCHNSDVTSVSWCPVPYNVLQLNKMRKDDNFNEEDFKNNDKTFLLASCCSDLTIYVSKAGTDNHCETLIKLPSKPVATTARYGQKRIPNLQRGRILKWAYPLVFVTFTDYNEIISVHLSKFDNKTSLVEDKQLSQSVRVTHMKYDVKVIHNIHKRNISSFAVFLNNSDEVDFRVWSYSGDRLIVRSGYNKNFKEKPMVLPLLSGYIFCMDISPTNPDLLAIGTGDGKISIWNMSSVNFIDITTLSKRIDHKVMSIQWHPEYEGVFAFGTYEGRVGLFDISQGSTLPTLFKTYHQKAVYRLCWAPPIYTDDSNVQRENSSRCRRSILSLFAVVDGDILQYNPNSLDELPVSLAQNIFAKTDQKCETCIGAKFKPCGTCKNKSDMCYEKDRKVIVLGYKSGEVRLFSAQSLELLHVITDQTKAIMSLTWHPKAVFDSPSEISSCSNWLAVAGENVIVYDIDEKNPPKKIASLDVHAMRVLHVAWSPHTNGRLITCSGDNTAIIWDVINQAIIGRYTKHSAQVFCGMWSPRNMDIVITGSADFTCRMWSISKETVSSIVKATKQNLKVIEPRIVNAVKPIENVEKSAVPKNSKNQTCFPSISHEFHDSSLLDKIFEEAINLHNPEREKLVNGRCKKHNLSFQNGSFNTSDDSFSIQEVSLNESGQGDNSMVGKPVGTATRKQQRSKSTPSDYSYSHIFGSKEQLTSLICQEELVLEESGSNDMYVLVQARDDLKNKINEAIEKNQVTEYLLALAASVSPKLWRDASQVYVEQMIHADRIFDAVNFLLALGQDMEAIDLLCEKKRFKEAFVLARLRFEDEPIINDIVEKWVQLCSSSGLYRLGAHCYMYLNEEEKASILLSKSKQSKDALLAAKLLKYYQPDRAMELAADCLKKDLTNLCLQNVEDIFIAFPEIKFMEPWYLSLKYFTEETPNTGSITKWIIGWLKNETPTISKNLVHSSGSADFEKLQNVIVDIAFQMNYNELTLYVSAQTALYFSGIFHSNFKVAALRHFIRGLSHCYNFRVVNSNQVYSDKAYPIMRLLKLMFPAGVQENFSNPSESDDTHKLYKSVNAYFCDFVVTWLAVCDELPKSLKCFEHQDVTSLPPSVSQESPDNKEMQEACAAETKNTENIKNISKIKEMDPDFSNSLNIIKNRKIKLQKVIELFNLFLDDVLNEDTIKYFKNVFELKKYETNTAHNDCLKIKATPNIHGRTSTENGHIDGCPNLNLSGNTNTVNESASNVGIKQKVIPAEISDKSILLSFEESGKTDSLKGNNELNNGIDSDRCKNSEKSNLAEERVSISDLLFNTHVSLEDVKILRGNIEKFEKESVSAPNPFIFVCTVRDFLSKHKDFEPELVMKLETMLANLVDKHGIM